MIPFLLMALALVLGCDESKPAGDAPKAKTPAPKPSPLPPAAAKLGTFDLAELMREQWFGVYQEGNKIGYQKLVARQQKVGGLDLIVAESLAEMALPGKPGVKVIIRGEKRYHAQPPHDLVYSLVSQELADANGTEILQRTEARRAADGYEVTLSRKGQTEKHAAAGLKATAMDEFAVEAWLRTKKPAVGESLAFEDADLSERKRVSKKAELVEVRPMKLRGKNIQARIIKITSADGQATTLAMAPDDVTQMMLHLPDPGLVIRLETREQALRKGGN